MRPRIGLVLVLVTAVLCGGCDMPDFRSLFTRLSWTVSGNTLASDLDEANQALRDHEWLRAEKLLERFLRGSTDPTERWTAWLLLLEATEHSGEDRRWTNDYLETMLVEFENDPARIRVILQRMGEVQEAIRQYDKAIATWTQLASLPNDEPDMAPELAEAERARILLRAAQLQIRVNRLSGADESLHECLALQLPDTGKLDCLLALAELSVLRDDLDSSANLSTQIMDISETPAILRARASFLLADIHEQRGQFAEAQRLFAAIRDDYPNPAVIDARLEYLKKKIKK